MNAVAVYDFTLKAEGITKDDILDWLSKNAKTWCFQLEEGAETGYVHFQGRISLRKKIRLSGQIKVQPWDNHCNWSVTSITNYENTFYVLKDDTRLEGPWTEKDERKIETGQITLFKTWELRPYQRWIKEECQRFCMRSINLIYDRTGNMGKSIFSEYMEFEGLIEEIPPYRLMDDIVQWVHGRQKKSAYFIDLPRGMRKTALGDLYSGIEVIKNGVAYDKRNYPKKSRFTRPRVFVFTNELPRLDLMSKDRWVIHTINENFEHVPYNPDEEPEVDSE